ncbi:MAG: ABC transporter permease [Bacillota bacterium]
MLKESVKMSWSNITHNKMRSFLTVLGIVIGVASIIALVSTVQGATGSITSQISALGANKITISARGTPLKQGLNENDLNRLSHLENVSGVSPTVSGNTSIVYNQEVKTGVTVQGKNQVYFSSEASNIASGRGINIIDVKNSSQVALIGSNIAKEMFLDKDPIGRQMLVNGDTYMIVGLMKPSGSFSLGSTSDLVLIPYTSAMKTLNVRNIVSVDVLMSDASQSDAIINNIKAVLNEAFNYHQDTFNIFNMQDMLNTMGNITGMMSLLLAGIASISLIVGGIGIMNMMLVTVTERTTEIGLRKALGAEPGRIQMQFLIESGFLSLFGGVIGLIVGVLIALVAAKLIGFTFTITPGTILLAVGFSVAVGIIFGFAPARKASRLNPIDALRYV